MKHPQNLRDAASLAPPPLQQNPLGVPAQTLPAAPAASPQA
jgi:hypothetical protein